MCLSLKLPMSSSDIPLLKKLYAYKRGSKSLDCYPLMTSALLVLNNRIPIPCLEGLLWPFLRPFTPHKIPKPRQIQKIVWHKIFTDSSLLQWTCEINSCKRLPADDMRSDVDSLRSGPVSWSWSVDSDESVSPAAVHPGPPGWTWCLEPTRAATEHAAGVAEEEDEPDVWNSDGESGGPTRSDKLIIFEFFIDPTWVKGDMLHKCSALGLSQHALFQSIYLDYFDAAS